MSSFYIYKNLMHNGMVESSPDQMAVFFLEMPNGFTVAFFD